MGRTDMKKTFPIVWAILWLACPILLAQTEDTHVGTWKLNQAKSKSVNPNAKPQQVPATLRITAVENGHHFVSDFVNANGQKVHTEYTAKYDGKDYPRTITTDGKPVKSTISIRKVDNYTYEHTMKNAEGRVITLQRSVVSKDGKTRTNYITGINAAGEKSAESVAVYERH
jgi:hypothetical protein